MGHIDPQIQNLKSTQVSSLAQDMLAQSERPVEGDAQRYPTMGKLAATGDPPVRLAYCLADLFACFLAFV